MKTQKPSRPRSMEMSSCLCCLPLLFCLPGTNSARQTPPALFRRSTAGLTVPLTGRSTSVPRRWGNFGRFHLQQVAAVLLLDAIVGAAHGRFFMWRRVKKWSNFFRMREERSCQRTSPGRLYLKRYCTLLTPNLSKPAIGTIQHSKGSKFG